tara:strand:+ start:748 stop:1455 length:708 start_codon:yes stop_codon:yes gene_type:complete
MMGKALVVLSGGQDSTTCLFWAKAHYDYVETITFDYRQRHRREIQAAMDVSAMAGCRHELINVPECLNSASPLTSDNALETYGSAEDMDQIIGGRRELTFIPMRNALFLTIAANRAEQKGIDTIITGVCQMDNANYDDCRKTFLIATEQYINTALGHDHRGTQWITIEAPLLYKTKAESIHMAQTLGAMKALGKSHTCYAGESPPCGICHACVLRASGFEEAGIDDPIFEELDNE